MMEIEAFDCVILNENEYVRMAVGENTDSGGNEYVPMAVGHKTDSGGIEAFDCVILNENE